MKVHPRIVQARAEPPFTVHLTFTDGSTGAVDLAPWLKGRGGVFAALQDPAFFARVTVLTDAGTIVWPNGVDLDPDVLYEAAQRSQAAPLSRGGV